MAKIAGLWVYPIKSCRGIALDASALTPDGLQWDRHWMLVDREGKFLTQRQHPHMALIETALGADSLRVCAPGAAPLDIAFETRGKAVRVIVWRDECAAFDAGEVVAQWFSEVIGTPCRLVAFDTGARRLSDPKYTGDIEAGSRFSDGFALLVISDASLAALNQRLSRHQREAVPMARFRPSLTLSGIEAFDEDYVRELRSDHGVALRLVKPCARCIVTTVDPATGVRNAEGEPLATLNEFRVDRNYGTIFGQNAIVVAGAGARLACGDELQVEWNF